MKIRFSQIQANRVLALLSLSGTRRNGYLQLDLDWRMPARLNSLLLGGRELLVQPTAGLGSEAPQADRLPVSL